MKSCLVLLILSFAAWAAQAPASQSLSPEEEDRILRETVTQLGNSPEEFIRGMERFLRKYPHSTRRADLERAIFKAAVDARDTPRIISYGEKVLEHDNDITLLDRVARALLAADDAASARRSLKYSERLEKAAREARAKSNDAARTDELDRTIARALVLQARARGNIGDLEKAIAAARQSSEVYPTGEAAREAARWEMRLSRFPEAIEHYAEAFAIPDPKVTDADRKLDRAVLGELYRKVHGSETGLGDLVLKAYDRTAQAVEARDKLHQAGNPNAGLQDGFQYRLAGLRGDSIRLVDFRGKVLVLDFWATWCAPCRDEHPLLEQLKTKYKGHNDVVFLSINADEDRSRVRPFLEEVKWSDQVYFEDGLVQFYRVGSLPTTLVFNKRAEMVSRLLGFAPENFLELLGSRIEEARSE